MDFGEWRHLSFTLLEALIFSQGKASIWELLLHAYLKITYELNTIWIDIDRRSPITSVCGSNVTSAVYTNRSQLQDAASIWFLLEGLIFDKTCGFYLRFMNTIWEQKTDRRLLLWIRCNAGRTQTALNYKTRLLFDLRLSDLWSIEICRRRLRSQGKSTFFSGKPVVSGFSHLLLIPISFYMFLMHNGAKRSWIH